MFHKLYLFRVHQVSVEIHDVAIEVRGTVLKLCDYTAK